MVRDFSGPGKAAQSLPSKGNDDQNVRGGVGSHFLGAVLGMLRAVGKDTDIRDDQLERLEGRAVPGEGIPRLTGCGDQDKGGATEPALGA